MTILSRRVRWLAPTVTIALALGVVGALASPSSAATSTFTQDTDIFVDDSSFAVANTALVDLNDNQATPYPSTINVAHNAVITDLEVSFVDMNHVYPDDVDILLVGPQGQQVTLMSDAGSGGDLVDVDLTFDDSAPTALPDAAQITSGTYQPSNFETFADPYNPPAPTSTGGTSLSVFNGTLAAGDWNLFAVDDIGAFEGEIQGGWFISFTFATTPYPSTIDVAGLPAISDVNVTVSDITTTILEDLNLLLVGPGGQSSFLMGDAGGPTDIANLDLTFDDEAAAPLPNADPLVNGSYQPVSYGANTFPAPAPATGASVLNVFDGLSPNGQWRLFADDDSGDDLITISSWSLDFTWADNQVPTGTVNINGGAASTSSQNVTLNLSANDPAPATGVTQMRFSNDGVTFSAYQAYATTAAWTLTTGDGTKTVYAQFRDGDGNQSAVATDAITLALPDTTGPTVTKTTPKNNAKNVKVTTKVKIKASEALKGSTVTKKTVFLKAKGSSNKVKAKVKYNSAKKMIVLTPDKALKSNKKYNVTVTTKVKDVAGNAFDAKPGKSGAQALKFSFTTA